MVLVLIRLSALTDKADIIFMRMLGEPMSLMERVDAVRHQAKHERYLVIKPPMCEIVLSKYLPDKKENTALYNKQLASFKKSLIEINQIYTKKELSKRGLWPTDYNYEVTIE
jgi:hypothetical protein